MIITQQLSLNATKNLSKGAIRYLGKEITYADLRIRISRLSYLHQHEIGNHARVAFFARNSPAYLFTFFALTNNRSIVIPIDPDRPPAEIIDWIKESKATHVAVTSDLVNQIRDIMGSGRLSLPIIEIEKKQGGEYAQSFTPPPDQVPQDTDTVVLFRTGGVTGKPKFVAMNHKQLQHAAMCLRGRYHAMPTDRYYTSMSWAHPFALIHGMLVPMLLGGTCVIDHGLEGLPLLDFLVESRVTRLVGTPQFYFKLLLVCRDEKRSLPGTKSATVGLGQLTPEIRKVLTMLKVPVLQTYGQTEAGWTLAMEDLEERPENPDAMYVGRGLAGIKYKVVDRAGDTIESNEEREGLLAVSGPNVMAGYMDLEKETKMALRGTWLYTGDYARLNGSDDTLEITFLGRKDDIRVEETGIIRADTIDNALKGAPGIAAAAGFFVKTSKGTDVPAVAIVKAPGIQVNEKSVLELCTSRIAGDAMPTVVVFTDMIPRDAGGSVNRLKLRGQFAGAAG